MGAEEVRVQDVEWNINYKVRLGETWGGFMEGLREKEIWGTCCEECGRVFVPPQAFCEGCLAAASEWKRVGASGTLKSFTVSYHQFPGSPEAPYALGVIQLEGADTGLLHLLGGVDLGGEGMSEALEIGQKVEAVWAEERYGWIRDIEYFRPAE